MDLAQDISKYRSRICVAEPNIVGTRVWWIMMMIMTFMFTYIVHGSLIQLMDFHIILVLILFQLILKMSPSRLQLPLVLENLLNDFQFFSNIYYFHTIQITNFNQHWECQSLTDKHHLQHWPEPGTAMCIGCAPFRQKKALFLWYSLDLAWPSIKAFKSLWNSKGT